MCLHKLFRSVFANLTCFEAVSCPDAEENAKSKSAWDMSSHLWPRVELKKEAFEALFMGTAVLSVDPSDM